MDKIGTTASSPVLIRTYKKEAELEIWKMTANGQYALLKTYPMCRWSGQLGPKTREGDRQVPEGFYPITPLQMNPNSNYYLSFNVGYPNAYDQAWGRTGGNIMVHGVCSSAGCFSMTDAQIADIYAVAREAFNGGQREIQMESFPFRMTSENMARYRLDPNIAFWKELKVGSDHFEVTKTEPPVLVCNRHYEFGASADGSVSAREPCPTLKRDESTERAVAEKAASDQSQVEKLVAQGVQPIRTVYEDGGQNPSFAGMTGDDVSRSQALVDGEHDIPIGEAPAAAAKPVVKVAAVTPAPEPAPIMAAAEPETATAATPYAATSAASGLSLAKIPGMGWLNPNASNAVASAEPTALPTSAPLPPQRAKNATLAANAAGPLDLSSLKPKPHKTPVPATTDATQ
jgi:murein L,D-transpeptidase YafK